MLYHHWCETSCAAMRNKRLYGVLSKPSKSVEPSATSPLNSILHGPLTSATRKVVYGYAPYNLLYNCTARIMVIKAGTARMLCCGRVKTEYVTPPNVYFDSVYCRLANMPKVRARSIAACHTLPCLDIAPPATSVTSDVAVMVAV